MSGSFSACSPSIPGPRGYSQISEFLCDPKHSLGIIPVTGMIDSEAVFIVDRISPSRRVDLPFAYTHLALASGPLWYIHICVIGTVFLVVSWVPCGSLTVCI